MSYWNAKFPNDQGYYEITFASKYKEKTKIVEKVCQAIIDEKVKSPDDVAVVIHARWEYMQDDEWRCSNCHTIENTGGQWRRMDDAYCRTCGAKMDLGGNDETE